MASSGGGALASSIGVEMVGYSWGGMRLGLPAPLRAGVFGRSGLAWSGLVLPLG